MVESCDFNRSSRFLSDHLIKISHKTNRPSGPCDLSGTITMKLTSLSSLLTILSICPSLVSAEDRSPERVCYDTCYTCLKPVHFDDMLNGTNWLTKACYSPKAILSLYLCLDEYCTPGAREAGLTPLNKTCEEKAHIVLPPFSIVENEDRERVRRLERNETEGDKVFGEVVIPSKEWFGIWWDTLVRLLA